MARELRNDVQFELDSIWSKRSKNKKTFRLEKGRRNTDVQEKGHKGLGKKEKNITGRNRNDQDK